MQNTMEFAFYAGFTDMCRRVGIRKAVEYAAKEGFSAVEPLEGTTGQTQTVRDVSEARELRKILADFGMRVACYSVGTSIYRAPAAVDDLCRQVEIAAEMGSPFLHHTIACGLTVPISDAGFASMLPELIENACRVAETARSYGIRCIYEDQGFSVNGVEHFGKFFAAVHRSCPNTGICGDMGNIRFVDESTTDFFQAFAPHIVHVHCKDYRIHENETAGCYRTKAGRYLENALPGTGVVDYPACFRILRENGYAGAFALELEGFTANEEILTDSNRKAMQYCRNVWDGE